MQRAGRATSCRRMLRETSSHEGLPYHSTFSEMAVAAPDRRGNGVKGADRCPPGGLPGRRGRDPAPVRPTRDPGACARPRARRRPAAIPPAWPRPARWQLPGWGRAAVDHRGDQDRAPIMLAAGIPETQAHPHTLRHTFGRLYMAAPGFELSRLQTIMGHASPETTSRYVHHADVELAAELILKDRRRPQTRPDCDRAAWPDTEPDPRPGSRGDGRRRRTR
jgi:Phage integrase family